MPRTPPPSRTNSFLSDSSPDVFVRSENLPDAHASSRPNVLAAAPVSSKSMIVQFTTFMSREPTFLRSFLTNSSQTRVGDSARGESAQVAVSLTSPASAAATDKGKKKKAKVFFNDELVSYSEKPDKCGKRTERTERDEAEAEVSDVAEKPRPIVASKGGKDTGSFASASSVLRRASKSISSRRKAPPESDEFSFDTPRFIARNVRAAKHPTHAWCERLVRFAQCVNQHPTLLGRFERADALWQVADALEHQPTVRQKLVDALGKICVVQNQEVSEFEALVENFPVFPAAESAHEQSQLSKARGSALLTLSLEIVHLPVAARERMARKVFSLMPAFSYDERASLSGVFMLLLPSIPPRHRLSLLQFMLIKALDNASPVVAQAFLQRTAKRIGKIGLERVAAATHILMEVADAFALSDANKAELLSLAMRENAHLLPTWLSGKPWVQPLDGRAFEALLEMLELLDEPDLQLAVPFLAAHLASCEWDDGDHRAHRLIALVGYAVMMSSSSASQATLRALVQGIYVRSQPSGELVGEIQLLLEACNEIAQPGILLLLLKEISAQMPMAALQISHTPLLQALAERYRLLSRRMAERASQAVNEQVGD